MLRLWAVAQRIGSVMTDQSAKIEIEVPPSDYTGPSIIFWTLHKAGSRYFYSVVKKLARSAGAPMLNIAAEYFQAGEKVELTPEWMNQVVDHTGLPAKPAMVKALADAHVADVQEEEVTKHRRQIRPGDHKRKLEQSTIDELNALYGDIIELFGYEK